MIGDPIPALLAAGSVLLGFAALPTVRAFAPDCRRTGAVTAIIAGQTVLSWAAACLLVPPWSYFSLILGWVLLVLALIDTIEMRLPDPLTLPLIGLGLAIPFLAEGGDPLASGIGALAGYGTFTLIATGYRRLRGQAGLGQGDAKLLAAAGAWLGWQALAPVVLVASGGALAMLAVRRLVFNRPWAAETPLPFGPFLCGGVWLLWLWG